MSNMVEIRNPDLEQEYPCPACEGGDGQARCTTCMTTGRVTRPPSLVPESTLDHWQGLGWELVTADDPDESPAAEEPELAAEKPKTQRAPRTRRSTSTKRKDN